MVDPEAGKLIIIGAASFGASVAGTLPAAQLVKEFVLKIFGPTADEFGKLIASPFAALNERRAKRASQLVDGAARILADQGVEPQQVPDYLLLPLLSHGSLIEDSDLQAAWAQLLASASADSSLVSPAFPQMLSELSSNDVRFLSELIGDREFNWYEQGGASVSVDYYFHKQNRRRTLEDAVTIENIIRLGIMRRDPPAIELKPEKLAEMMVKMTKGKPVFPARLNEEQFPRYSITALGIRFMVACAGPGAIKFKERPQK